MDFTSCGRGPHPLFYQCVSQLQIQNQQYICPPGTTGIWTLSERNRGELLVTWTRFYFAEYFVCERAQSQSPISPLQATNSQHSLDCVSGILFPLLIIQVEFQKLTVLPKSENFDNMNSDNWRAKRDPSDAKEQTRTPMRSYQQRQNRSGFENNSNTSSPFGNRPSPFQGQSRDGLRKPLSDGNVDKAIEEGRRLYVGNLPYEVCLHCSYVFSC